MIYFIGIVCVFAFIGGMVSEYYRQKRMTPAQQRERQQEHFQTAAGIIIGTTVGTVTAAKTIVKKAGE